MLDDILDEIEIESWPEEGDYYIDTDSVARVKAKIEANYVRREEVNKAVIKELEKAGQYVDASSNQALLVYLDNRLTELKEIV